MDQAPRQSGVFATARVISRVTAKDDDFAWARYATRPYAAVLLAALDGRVAMTPNGISIVSLVFGLAASAAFAFWPGQAGLWAGFALSQLSYTVDCMDGMYARYKGMRSPVGVEVDFLVDGIKQVALFPAIGWRLWIEAGQPIALPQAWMVHASWIGTVAVASGLMMTTFLRSPGLTGAKGQVHRPKRGGSVVGVVMRAVSFLMNYPSWIIIPVAMGRMDVFLAISLPLYGAYCGYAGLQIVMKVVPTRHYVAFARSSENEAGAVNDSIASDPGSRSTP